MIKLLIVDDSPVAQEFLKHIFSVDSAIQVVGVARNGQEAVELTASLRPDVITMDLYMPVLDGLGATRKIMETCATPIVIVSGNPDVKEAAFTFQLLDAGALAVVLRPPGVGELEYERSAKKLIETVKTMSEIRVVSRPLRHTTDPAFVALTEMGVSVPARDVRLVAIGASIGGPQALQKILCALPKEVPAPILIVQHIAFGFVAGFAEWLQAVTGFPVHLAVGGETPLPGHVYIPPDSVHMGIVCGPQIILSTLPPEENLRPSVSFLFRTVAKTMGSQAAGVLLTGMGKDGANELKLMRDAGAITFAQSSSSSVVFGMPGEAIALGAASHVLNPEGIAAFLGHLFAKPRG